jgi:hypothetical protein
LRSRLCSTWGSEMRIDLIGSPRLFGFALFGIYLFLMGITAVEREEASHGVGSAEQLGPLFWFMSLLFLVGIVSLLIQRPAPAAILGTVAALISGGMMLFSQQDWTLWVICMIVLALVGWINVLANAKRS